MIPVLSKRLEDTIESEINLCLDYPDKRIIYISFGSSSSDHLFEKYDENKIMVASGDLSLAPIVLRKLHEYQKFINSRATSKNNN
jgi:hypothetical protein